MKPLRFAVLGTGFWSRFQIAAWKEIGGAELVAVYNRTRKKAEEIAAEFGVPNVYDSPEDLLAAGKIDFVDIITSPDTHEDLVALAAAHKLPVICQKPMANDFESCRRMVALCEKEAVPLMIHENWRWQHPMRALKSQLQSGIIGKVFRARVIFSCSFPVFDNQPFLREVDRFILTDIGSHIFDTARFLFGDAQSVYCQTQQVNKGIKGEDVATAMIQTCSGATVNCEMSYASRLEHEAFPQTFVLAEGEAGSVELGRDYWLRTTTREGTQAQRVPPPRYSWADPQYDLVHASIAECNRDLLNAIRSKTQPETSGADNLKTMRLVYSCYESAEQHATIALV